MNKVMVVLIILGIALASFFRLSQLDQWPPSPYWEEVVNGYDAFSLLESGRDHHGNWLPLVALESYGDRKPALYAYSIIPFIAVFGLDTWVVRLPSAVAGILMVVGIGCLAQSLTEVFSLRKGQTSKKSKWQWLPVIAILVSAISPWLILFSRGGWEANLATSFIVWAVVTSLRAIKKSKEEKSLTTLLWWLLAGLLLALSMYTYHAARFVAPMLGAGLIAIWFWEFKLAQQKKSVISTSLQFARQHIYKFALLAVAMMVLLWPLLSNLRSPAVTSRFGETSILNEVGGDMSLAVRKVIANYFLHFNLDFLFISGDRNARHSVQFMGQLYYIEVLFLLLGIYVALRKRNVYMLFLGYWLAVGIFPAAITAAAPHALRSLVVVPALLLLISMGILEFISLSSEWLSTAFSTAKKGLIMTMISLMLVGAYGLQVTMFWRFYTKIYPVEQGHNWQYGYQQLVEVLEVERQKSAELPIFVSRALGRPVMYFLFFTQAEPDVVQSQSQVVALDQGEMLRYNTYYFVKGLEDIPQIKSVVAIPSSEAETFLQRGDDIEIVTTVKDLWGKDLWHIFQVQ